MISSRSVGFYLGTGFDRAQGVINGSTIFGGYDAGRFNGTVYNYTMASSNANPFQVHVSSIKLNDPTANIENLEITSGSGFDAEISSEQYPMSLPKEVTQNFATILAAAPTDSDDGSLRVTKPFKGTMTVTLSDGFQVTLAPEVVANVSGISPVATFNEDSSKPFVLGGSWLSQVYMMINYDDDTFHLAQAILEAKFIMPRTMCPKVVPQPYLPPKLGFAKAGLIGAVIGGVLGGSALLTIAVTIFVSLRRSRTKKRVRYFDGERGGVKIATFTVEDDDSLEGPRKPWKKVPKGSRRI